MSSLKALRWSAMWVSVTLLTAFVLVQSGLAEGVPGYRAPRAAGIGIAEPTSTNYTGLYLGGGVGGGWADSELSGRDTYLNNNGTLIDGAFGNINGLSGRGLLGDVRAGFDLQLGTSPFVIGVLGGYSWGSMDFDAGFNANPATNLVSIDASLTPTWYAGGRVGFVFPNKTLAYVGYARTQADLDVSATAFGGDFCTDEHSRCNHTLDGNMWLAGVEFPMAANVKLGLEYTYTQYDRARLFDGRDATTGAGTVLDLDPDVHAVKARLSIHFGN